MGRRGERLHALISRYLADLIFGANDGIITTLAVISGVVGASLSAQIIIILGFANLLADGFSMGASNVLSRRSEAGGGELMSLRQATRHGTATFVGFGLAGFVPLAAYLVPGLEEGRFAAAWLLALGTLFLVGAGRAFFTPRGFVRSGAEMLLIGALAGAVAYAVGAIGAALAGLSGG